MEFYLGIYNLKTYTVIYIMKKGVTKKHDISCLTLLWIDIGISPTSHIMAFVCIRHDDFPGGSYRKPRRSAPEMATIQ
jgi:hypothetical protein